MVRKKLERVAAVAAFVLLAHTGPARASDPVPVQRPGGDPRTLYLRAATVDTRQHATLLGPDAAFSADVHYVMQLDGPMTPQRRDALTAAGVSLGDYLPMHAYIVNLAQADAKALADLPFVAWLGRYADEWKLCPALSMKKSYVTEGRKQLAAKKERVVIAHLFSDADVPAGVNALRNSGGKLRHVQRTAADAQICLEIHDAAMDGLKNLPHVMFVEEAAEGGPRNVTANWICQSNDTAMQSTPLWDNGLDGSGQIVGIIDWDLNIDHCAFSDTQAIGGLHRKIQAYYIITDTPQFGWHGTHVGGIIAADDPALTNPNLRGLAFGSRFVFQHWDDFIDFNQVTLNTRLTIAHDDGARIHNNSWGAFTETSYHHWSRDTDLFSRNNEDDLVLNAIDNGSEITVRTPENAKNCIAVGAARDTPNQELWGDGVQGPAFDGRQKPDVWAPGSNSVSANDSSTCGVVTQVGAATSWATPAATAMATLARQYFTDGYFPSGAAVPTDAFIPSGALLKAIVLNSAVDMSGFAGYFGTHEGYGRVLMDNALFFPGDTRGLLIEDVRNADGLSTGESNRYYITVQSNVEPVHVTLVWTDVPATIGTAFAPVNNLDLTVTDSMGSVFLGNVFDATESTTGGASDTLNNVEQVRRLVPKVGTWQIDIDATAVNVDQQGFALVISGDVDCVRGDVNADGQIDGRDIAAFLDVVIQGGGVFASCAADMNFNQSAGLDDLAAFTAALVGN